MLEHVLAVFDQLLEVVDATRQLGLGLHLKLLALLLVVLQDLFGCGLQLAAGIGELAYLIERQVSLLLGVIMSHDVHVNVARQIFKDPVRAVTRHLVLELSLSVRLHLVVVQAADHAGRHVIDRHEHLIDSTLGLVDIDLTLLKSMLLKWQLLDVGSQPIAVLVEAIVITDAHVVQYLEDLVVLEDDLVSQLLPRHVGLELLELAELLALVHASRVERDLLAGVVHVDVHDVHGLAGFVERIKLSPHVEYRALDVPVQLLLVEIVEANLRAEHLVPNGAYLVVLLVEVNVIVHDVDVLRLDLHGKAFAVLSKVPDEEPVLPGLSDLTLDLDLVVFAGHVVIAYELIQSQTGHVLERLRVQQDAVLIEQTLRLDLAVLRRDREVDDLQVATIIKVPMDHRLRLIVYEAPKQVLINRDQQPVVIYRKRLLL